MHMSSTLANSVVAAVAVWFVVLLLPWLFYWLCLCSLFPLLLLWLVFNVVGVVGVVVVVVV